MRAVLFLFFAILSFFVAGQSDDRVKLRDLQEAPGNDYIIVSLNDTAHWVLPASIMVNLYTSNGTIDAVRQVTLSDAAQLIIGDTSETVLFTMYPDEFNPQIGLSTTSDDNTETSMLFLQQSDAQIQSGNAGNYTVLMIDNDGHVTVTRTTGAASFAVNAGDPDATLDVGGGAMLLPDSVTYSAGLNRIVMIDSLTGRLHYINATDIETGGGTTYYQTLRDDGTPVTQRDAINFVATSTVATTLTDDAGNGETEVALSVIPGGIDHGGLAGLTDDDHTQYALLAGRSGGQILYGGTGTTDDLTLRTTSGIGASGASMFFQVGNNGGTNAMTIANNGLVGINNTSPTAAMLTSRATASTTIGLRLENSAGTAALTVRATDGTFTFGSTSASFQPVLNSLINANIAGHAVGFFPPNISNASAIGNFIFADRSYTSYSANQTTLQITHLSGGFKPSSGAQTYTALGVDPIINQTGTSSGAIYGVDYNPTLTAVTGTHYGILSRPTGAKNGFGTGTPTSTMHVVGTTRLIGSGSTSASIGLQVHNSTGTNNALIVQDDGLVGIGTNIIARTLHVAGEARITDLTTDTPTRIVGADADGDLNEITVGSGLTLSAGSLTANAGAIDHGGLLGLADDDHTQYLLLAGRATGQIATGGTASGDDLTLRSTTDATKGDIIIQDQGGNMILGGGATVSNFRIMEASGSGTEWTQFRTQPQSASVTYILPADNGDPGEVLQTNGTGTLSWEAGGLGTDVQEYPTAGTDSYVIPAGVRTVQIICIGGGGGGGSGRRGATTEANTGGGGGGGGAYTSATFAVSELSSTTLDLTIGAGASGGASRTTDNTSGADGGTGGDTYVECSGYTIILAEGGDFGRGGSTAEAAGGSANDVGDFFGYAGASSPTSGTPASTAGTFTKAAGGGGAGGSIATGGTPAVNGGACGKWNYATLSTIAGGTAPGGNGNDCPAVNTQHWIGGNGGSGGASSITGNAGTGGTGAQGGGGGGGGASLNATGNSGAGGTGGAGFIMIIAKY